VAWDTKVRYKLSDYGGRGKIKFGFSKSITLPHRDEPLKVVVYIHVRSDQNYQGACSSADEPESRNSTGCSTGSGTLHEQMEWI
jgi:hypothetical protein